MIQPGGAEQVAAADGNIALIDADQGEIRGHSCNWKVKLESDIMSLHRKLQSGKRILNGETIDPSEYYFRTTPYFETGAERYAWLNKLVTVGVGRRTATGVEYSIYAIK